MKQFLKRLKSYLETLKEFTMQTNANSAADYLDVSASHLKKIEGIQKLARSIQKELTSPFPSEQCSNLPHLLSIVNCIQSGNHSNPSAVLKAFTYSGGKTSRLIVDIVSKDGDEWCKVSARNPKSLALLAAGGGGYGKKTIIDHAQDYLDCAKENPCLFRPPKVTFIFTSGIGDSLADELESLGIKVEGEKIKDADLGTHPRIKVSSNQDFSTISKESSDDEEDEDIYDYNNWVDEELTKIKNPSLASLEGISKLNLDITALLAYVSNLTNGHTDVVFKKSILAQQVQFERERPQKPVLNKIFEGRQLYVCETALKEFNSILKTVGGPQEKIRAEEFLKRIVIVPDNPSERAQTLDFSGNIKSRSLIIFGTGDSIEAVTVTANSGFVRSSKTQGVEFPSFIHESRALTEDKETNGEHRTHF